MLNKEERERRKDTLGASDMGLIFNFDNKTAKDLWREKLGLIEERFFENKYTIAGNIIEETALNFFFENNSMKEVSFNDQVEHKDIKNLVSSLDAKFKEVDGGWIPVENKTINIKAYGELKTIPRRYLIQVQTQIACVGSKYGIIVFNAMESIDYEFPLEYEPNNLKQEYFVIERDDVLIKEIEERAKYFLWCLKYKREPSEKHFQAQRFYGNI